MKVFYLNIAYFIGTMHCSQPVPLVPWGSNSHSKGGKLGKTSKCETKIFTASLMLGMDKQL